MLLTGKQSILLLTARLYLSAFLLTMVYHLNASNQLLFLNLLWHLVVDECLVGKDQVDRLDKIKYMDYSSRLCKDFVENKSTRYNMFYERVLQPCNKFYTIIALESRMWSQFSFSFWIKLWILLLQRIRSWIVLKQSIIQLFWFRGKYIIWNWYIKRNYVLIV